VSTGQPKAYSVHHVALQTNDLDKSIHFYTQIIGAELVSRRPFKRRELAWMKLGPLRFEVFSKRAGETLEEWRDFYVGPVHLAFLVENLDEFLAHALENGARFHPSHPEPFIPPAAGATRIAYLLGPDGEEVEIRTE
jgi:glyoxylase I family protein